MLAEITRPTNTSPSEVHRVALRYVEAGISVIPVRLDGTKAPAFAWKEYQERLPTIIEVSRWFSRPAGIGIVCGAVSRGLEVIDFDDPTCFEPWQAKVAEIVDRLPVVETASGGRHVFYRCPHICGNAKIAMFAPSSDDGQAKATRIESRGQGGFVVAAGSPKGVHKSGRPYLQRSGPPLPQVPTITPDERAELWRAAASFNCVESPSQKVAAIKRQLLAEHYASNRPEGQIAPWDDFDRRAKWDDILLPHGWVRVTESSWRRPGKTYGTSATTGPNAEGIEILCVFSSNAGPLSGAGGRTCWGPFRAFTELNCGGDGREAARAVRALGFGSRGGR